MSIKLSQYLAEGPVRDAAHDEDARCAYKQHCTGRKSPDHKVDGREVCVDCYFDEFSRLIDTCPIGRGV